jgi:LPS O-antigen subunit length determinant protein (WzzB/FepE family)
MTEQPDHTYDDEISLLDILVTLAESWKLLVFGPLMAGVLAGSLSFLWPKTFESSTILRLNEEEVALLHAAPVLDPLIEKFGLLTEADGFLDDARLDLKKRLSFTVDKKTKLATITAKARSPELAQSLGQSAITMLLKELQIKGSEKVLQEKIIAINELAIASGEQAEESIQLGLKKGALTDHAQESAIKNLASIYSDLAKRRQQNEETKQKLEIRGAEVFVQEPSLPQRKSLPKRSLVVLLAVLASGFALLVFVFVRKAWAAAGQEADSARKLAAIKRSLGLQKVI